MKDETVFITGKITGDPNYREKFNKAQKELEEQGYIVLNPAFLPPYGFEYEAYMRMTIPMVMECETLCLLPDWSDSEGSRTEILVGLSNGKKVMLKGE